MEAKVMWDNFCKEYNVSNANYSVWAFGGDPDKLVQLVLDGIKVATASAYDLYLFENEPLPQVNDYSVIIDSNDNARCIIQTTKLYVVPFKDVSKEHAYKEGEGDRSLEYWREVHTAFFQECYEDDNLVFDENINVLCEEFKVVYRG